MHESATITDRVRAVFEARKDEALTHAQFFEVMGLSALKLHRERDAMRDILKYLVQGGYLVKVGSHRAATYQYTGQGMPKSSKTHEDRRRCGNERGESLGQPVINQPRERRMDKNTVARPRAVKRLDSVGQAETLEQFVARGGRVQRLAASWDQTA